MSSGFGQTYHRFVDFISTAALKLGVFVFSFFLGEGGREANVRNTTN